MTAHIIHTGRDGTLDSTSTSDIDAMLEEAKSFDRLVVYLHGGLVSESAGRETAERLTPEFLAAGAFPIFVVYETDFVATVRNNLHEIAQERVFQKLVKKVLKYAVAKLGDDSGARSSSQLSLPMDGDVSREFNRRRSESEEPYGGFEPASEITEVSNEQERQLIDELVADVALQETLQEVVNGATPENQLKEKGARGVVIRHQASSETLMSPAVVEELVDDVEAAGGRGVLSSAVFVGKVVKVFSRVVKRYIARRHHGLYATVVEEVLRELYLANLGGLLWALMKKDTADTFENVGVDPVRGGWYFIRQLGEAVGGGWQPEVSVVAHSLGSVFACNLIGALHEAGNNAAHPLPTDFTLSKLVLMAPAVDFGKFAATLSAHGDLIDGFRMFNLSEALEAGYWEVPLAYPRSLLYLVSGVAEKTDDGDSAFDHPLVGMQRYYDRTDVYDATEIDSVRQYVSSDPSRVLWSEEDRGVPGLATDAVRHGGFDDLGDRRKTIDSVTAFLQTPGG